MAQLVGGHAVSDEVANLAQRLSKATGPDDRLLDAVNADISQAQHAGERAGHRGLPCRGKTTHDDQHRACRHPNTIAYAPGGERRSAPVVDDQPVGIAPSPAAEIGLLREGRVRDTHGDGGESA